MELQLWFYLNSFIYSVIQIFMIPLINFKFQKTSIEKKLSGISKNIKKEILYLNYNVSLLEKKIAKYVNTKYCISCSSGTDALLMS